MTILKLAATAALALAAAPAAAQTWWLIDHGDAGSVFADTARLSADGQSRTIWVLQILATPNEEGAKSILAHWRYDCARATQSLHAFAALDADDEELIGGTIAEEEREIEAVAPETIASSALDFACASAEQRDALPFAFILMRPPEAVASAIPQLRAMGAEAQAAAFLAAFDPNAIPAGELREGYFETFREAIPENRRAAAAALLGISEGR